MAKPYPSSIPEAVELIQWLKTQPGWFSYDGDASVQAAMLLPNGHLLRVGLSDASEDISEAFWVDIYSGLHLKVNDDGR